MQRTRFNITISFDIVLDDDKSQTQEEVGSNNWLMQECVRGKLKALNMFSNEYGSIENVETSEFN